MAAELEKEDGVEVKTVRGGLGELSVSIDDRKVFDSSRFGYPTPDNILAKVRTALAEHG